MQASCNEVHSPHFLLFASQTSLLLHRERFTSLACEREIIHPVGSLFQANHDSSLFFEVIPSKIRRIQAKVKFSIYPSTPRICYVFFLNRCISASQETTMFSPRKSSFSINLPTCLYASEGLLVEDTVSLDEMAIIFQGGVIFLLRRYRSSVLIGLVSDL
jgi:hypothetical protein